MPRGLSWVSGELDEVSAGPKSDLERQVRSDDSLRWLLIALSRNPSF